MELHVAEPHTPMGLVHSTCPLFAPTSPPFIAVGGAVRLRPCLELVIRECFDPLVSLVQPQRVRFLVITRYFIMSPFFQIKLSSILLVVYNAVALGCQSHFSRKLVTAFGRLLACTYRYIYLVYIYVPTRYIVRALEHSCSGLPNVCDCDVATMSGRGV